MGRKSQPAFSEFIRVDRPGDKPLSNRPGVPYMEVYENSLYVVHLARNCPTGFGDNISCTHLSIKNRAKNAHHDWREFQLIKNALCGPESEAVEIYPAESRLHDTADQFHLWVFETDAPFPVGFSGRAVCDEPIHNGSQRKFKPAFRPADAMTPAEADALAPTTKFFLGSATVTKDEPPSN